MCYGIHSLHIRARVCFVKWEEEVKILQWRYEKENFLVVCSMMDHHILLFATNTGSHEHSFRTILGLFDDRCLVLPSITVRLQVSANISPAFAKFFIWNSSLIVPFCLLRWFPNLLSGKTTAKSWLRGAIRRLTSLKTLRPGAFVARKNASRSCFKN